MRLSLWRTLRLLLTRWALLLLLLRTLLLLLLRALLLLLRTLLLALSHGFGRSATGSRVEGLRALLLLLRTLLLLGTSVLRTEVLSRLEARSLFRLLPDAFCLWLAAFCLLFICACRQFLHDIIRGRLRLAPASE